MALFGRPHTSYKIWLATDGQADRRTDVRRDGQKQRLLPPSDGRRHNNYASKIDFLTVHIFLWPCTHATRKQQIQVQIVYPLCIHSVSMSTTSSWRTRCCQGQQAVYSARGTQSIAVSHWNTTGPTHWGLSAKHWSLSHPRNW